MKKQKMNRGVTLVEIAIVLVIIGLLLGGILKGQELINNAKVRAITDRQNSLKVAWFAFLDRYQNIAGDYVNANKTVPGANSVARSDAAAGNGFVEESESPLVFQQLTGAGYLRCPQCTATVVTTPSSQNSLQNTYGGVMAIFTDEYYYSSPGTDKPGRLLIHTGGRIPSNIISEVDRKLDDGIPNRGDVVYNEYDAQGATLPTAECIETGAGESDGTLDSGDPGLGWRYAQSTPPVEPNCGASVAI